MTNTQSRLAAVFARSTTAALAQSLRTLDSQAPSPERNWARAQLIQELERRHPAASAAVEAAYDCAAPDAAVDYVAVLLANLPA